MVDWEKYMLPCFSKMIFGIDCPGCGLQRSIVLLFEGQVTNAFKMYPAVGTTLVFFMFVGLHFIDKKRSYHQLMIIFAVINAFIMIFAYFYKIFYSNF